LTTGKKQEKNKMEGCALMHSNIKIDGIEGAEKFGTEQARRAFPLIATGATGGKRSHS
jgi:hypothetical protein